MESAVSLQDVANIVTFVAPGYFAIQVYSIFYAKRQRDFPHLLIESVLYSLAIVTLANFLWQTVLRQEPVDALHVSYAFFVFAVSIAVGGLATYLRNAWPAKSIARKFGFGSPNEDFVKAQFLRLKPRKAVVTVKLKSDATFSGTPERTSRYSHGGQKYYYFTNIAWYHAKTQTWEDQEGGIIIESEEIEYIVTPGLTDD